MGTTKRRGRAKGFRHSAETKEKIRAKAKERTAGQREEEFPDVPVPSVPETSPGREVRSGLFDDLRRVEALARMMCAGEVPPPSISEWQAWVSGVCKEARRHLVRLPEKEGGTRVPLPSTARPAPEDSSLSDARVLLQTSLVDALNRARTKVYDDDAVPGEYGADVLDALDAYLAAREERRRGIV